MSPLNDVFTLDPGARAYEFLTRQRLWHDQIARVLDHAPDLPDAPRVLDLGCAWGVSSFVLAERLGPAARVVGVDLSRPMIARARRHHAERFPHLRGVSFLRADATALPFEDGAFDLAAGHSFLYLCPDRPGVLAEVRRVLGPGGRLVLMEPSAGGSLPRAAMTARVALPAVRADPIAAARFAASMVGWRVASLVSGRLAPARLIALLREAGFESATCRPTLGGLGLHASGRVP
ncbi:MAG: class I SAM-dependent methyltransferase [Myxococcota bacterium]